VAWPNPSYTRWLGGGERAVVEDGLTLSVHKVMRTMRNSMRRSGVWQWYCNGEACASISYTAEKWGQDCGRLKLSYRANGEPVELLIDLVRRPCRFGGGRWFAYCPHTRRVAAKLYVPAGGRHFLSRYAYKLAYRSQRECRAGRAILARDRLVARLGLFDWEVPIRPKWMRQRTFEKAVDRLEQMDQIWAIEAMARFGVGVLRSL
jgi:hypothetical protein